jgi:hypothetical protein
MEYIYKMGRNDLAKPPRKFYIRLLHAYGNSRDENAGVLAEGFLRHMNMTGETPDTFCYNIAIKAWTRGTYPITLRQQRRQQQLLLVIGPCCLCV